MKKKAIAKKTAAPGISDPMKALVTYNRTEEEKRPTEIAVSDLFLDPKNPRLADAGHTGTQASMLKVLREDFDLQPLIDSMYRIGYFWEEPLVAVREPLPGLKGGDLLVVVEGNRRLAALKTIFGSPETYDNKDALARLEKVPVIIRDDRKETLAFVGFRHITGIVPWEAAAKAQYAHDLVKRGLTLKEIAQTIGDKTQDIARWVRTQSLVEHANDQGLNQSDAIKAFYFSYLLTSTDAPGTKRWLEAQIDPDSGLVTAVNSENLEDLWYWLYGSKSRELQPVVPESRQIHKLNKVIASPVAVLELRRTGNLERALVETKDQKVYLTETLGSIRSHLQDLAAYLIGEDVLAGMSENDARPIKAEFSRIEKALAEVKSKLGF